MFGDGSNRFLFSTCKYKRLSTRGAIVEPTPKAGCWIRSSNRSPLSLPLPFSSPLSPPLPFSSPLSLPLLPFSSLPSGLQAWARAMLGRGKRRVAARVTPRSRSLARVLRLRWSYMWSTWCEACEDVKHVKMLSMWGCEACENVKHVRMLSMWEC